MRFFFFRPSSKGVQVRAASKAKSEKHRSGIATKRWTLS